MSEKLPAGVEYLFGSLYRIRLSCILTADGGFDPEAKILEFKNPRWTEVDGKRTGRGFSQEEMEELRGDIQVNGLNQVLLCRWLPFMPKKDRKKPTGIQLVDGERRFRSLSLLVKNNDLCYDKVSGEMVPASKLYEFVDCRVEWMDDDHALAVALQGNETSVQIGTGAYIGLVKHLRQVGKTDEEVLAICKKSPDWLCKTEKFFALDPDTFRALCEDKINRRVARTLGQEPDMTVRMRKLKLALAATDERIAAMQEALTDAQLDKELAEAEAEIAAEQGDTQASADAKARVEKAKKREKRAKQSIARPRTNITSGKDMEAAAVTDAAKPLTPAKMRKFLYDPTLAIIKVKGIDPESGEPMGIDLDDARLLKAVLDLLQEGTTGDPETLAKRFLQAHKKRKDRVAAGAAK